MAKYRLQNGRGKMKSRPTMSATNISPNYYFFTVKSRKHQQLCKARFVRQSKVIFQPKKCESRHHFGTASKCRPSTYRMKTCRQSRCRILNQRQCADSKTCRRIKLQLSLKKNCPKGRGELKE
jgi:hypothetical protein